MRKNIKNDKVIKAITIGLATMIAATSVPTSVFADETESSGTESSETAGSSDSSESSSDSSSSENSGSESGSSDNGGGSESSQPAAVEASLPEASAVAMAAPAAAPVEVLSAEQIAQAQKEVAAAQEAVENLYVPAENPAADAGLLPDAIDAVEEAYLNETVQSAEVKEIGNSIVDDLKDAETLVQKTNAGLEEIKKKDLSQGSNNSVNPYENTSGSVEVVTLSSNNYDEKGNIDPEKLVDEDGNLNTAIIETSTDPMIKDFYDNYSQAVDQMKSGEYDEAWKFVDKAEEQITEEEAKVERLKTVIQDSKAAEAAVKNAKAKAETLAAMKDQFYNLLVHYFRDDKMLGSGGAKYDSEGHLDVDKCEDAAINGKKVDKAISSLDQKTFMLGRKLLEDMVVYNLLEQGVDYDTISFGEAKDAGIKHLNEGKEDDRAWAYGELTSQNGKDRVVIENNNTGSGKFAFYQATNNNGDDTKTGRTNHVYVTYDKKNEDGSVEKVTRMFNIVYASKDEGFTDSPVFVSEIKCDENGNWSYQKYDDADRLSAGYLDRYDPAMLEEADKAYNKAVKELQEAEEEAAKLRAEVESLGFIATNTETRVDLEKKLEDAEKAVKESKENLATLKSVLNAISPKKNANPAQPEDNDDDDDDSPATFDPASGTLTVPFEGVGPIVLPGTGDGGTATGVLGVRTGGGEEEVGGTGREIFGTAPRANFDTVKKVLGATQNKKGNQQLKKITDSAVPLADIPNMDDESMSWWWLLVIFLFGAAGKKMYDKYKERKEAKNISK